MRLLKLAFEDIHDDITALKPSKFIIFTNTFALEEAVLADSMNPFLKNLDTGEDIIVGIPINSPWYWSDTIKLHLKFDLLRQKYEMKNFKFSHQIPDFIELDYLDESLPIFMLKSEHSYAPRFFPFISGVEFSEYKIVSNDDLFTFRRVKEILEKHNIPVVDESKSYQI